MPEETTPRLKARERGRARRRLRYLRQLRELQLRDAGGFVFDLYRFGERRDALVRDKLDALIVTDKEIRVLEALLGVGGRVHEVRRPGVGACASCGAFHSTDARYCAKCGAELRTAAKAAGEAPAESATETPTVIAEAPAPMAAEQPSGLGPMEEEQGESAEADAATAEPVEAPAAADEPVASEVVQSGAGESAQEPVPPEPDGDVTVVRTAEDAPAANGHGSDPGAGEVAAVGPSEPSRARRMSPRRRRGQQR